MIARNRPHALIFVFLFLGTTNSQNSNFIEKIEAGSVIGVECFNHDSSKVGRGTGLMLWNYFSEDSLYLLTAEHVFLKFQEFRLILGITDRGYMEVSKKPFALTDSLGNRTYLSYVNGDGRIADIALFPISKNDVYFVPTEQRALTRSFCVFGDSIFLGDRMVMCGLADEKVFEFVRKGDYLVTSGIVSHIAKESFLIDKSSYKGMSGGIVLKEYPVDGDFMYKAAGIVIASYSRHEDYSWVIKLDYIDSILIQETGNPWKKK